MESLPPSVDPARLLRELDKYDAQQSLSAFCRLAWHVVEPARPCVWNWHLDAICEHLEAVSRGQITRLLINIPPGCMKSLSSNVFWTGWEWGPLSRPSTRYISTSYSESLTIRDNRRARALIQSSWYKERWPNFELMGDQNEKIKFENNKTGFKIATSVGGVGTGERGDRVVVDDPHNVKDSESDVKRVETLRWFTEVLPTRMTDPDRSAIVVIMQRVHEMDVSGLILSEDLGYVHLCLPMEFEPERRCTTMIGFTDPRTEEGELLFPARFPEHVVERDKKVMGSYAVAGQFQQAPAPRGGGLFKVDLIKRVKASELPPGRKRVRGWDLAGSNHSNSPYTAGVLMSRWEDKYYIEHVFRERATPHRMEELIISTAEDFDGPEVIIDMPQDPGQAGKFQARYFVDKLSGFPVYTGLETGSKEMRAMAFAAQVEAENFHIVDGPWVGLFLDELSKFPASAFKDQTDAASRAFRRLAGRQIREQTVPIAPVAVEMAQ